MCMKFLQNVRDKFKVRLSLHNMLRVATDKWELSEIAYTAKIIVKTDTSEEIKV
jgi:hypothetical protein